MPKLYVALALLELLMNPASGPRVGVMAFTPNIQIGPEQSAMMRTHPFSSSSLAVLNFNGKRIKLRSKSHLFFFRRREEDSNEDDNKGKSDGANETQDDDSKQTSFGIRIPPFFSRMQQTSKETKETESNTDSSTAIATAPPPVAIASAPATTPEEFAKKLRADADKARLEAERMEAELTLAKIDRLEKQLVHAKKMADSGRTEKSNVEELQREMDILQRKLRGESVTAPALTATASKVSVGELSSNETTSGLIARDPKEVQKAVDEIKQVLELSPGFMLKMLAASTGLNVSFENMNQTELALRLAQIASGDFSFTGKPPPTFSQAAIDEQIQMFRENPDLIENYDLFEDTMPLSQNETERAIRALEYEYYMKELFTEPGDPFDIAEMLLDGLNGTLEDRLFLDWYPKCTRKEGQEPTEQQVERLIVDILPKTPFASTEKPRKVPGGFVIRGNSKEENGDKLIEAIDAQLAKSPALKDKLTVLYTRDWTTLADLDQLDAFGDVDASLELIESSTKSCLYVLGPDIVRERRRIPLSIVSACGLATSWYLSIYPFLLNPLIGKRVEEDLALADAGMVPDLTWLSDLSVPLFITFMSLQVLHEIGHGIAGAARGLRASFPTFVPSVITGITSTVTTFKNPPKNKESLFDFAIAGPLVGMLASIVAIIFGSQLTVIAADPSVLPALPLEILRQSTLGGGIIDGILGNGALNVPEGALGTEAVAAMTIPLHPVAVAGFISLIVNALAMLPIGTTDGGRVALALFGRNAKMSIGLLALGALFLVGLLGSDLFLFYFAFVISFQSGNEIPARNEVDNVGFSRVLVATGAYVLGLLTLIPFQ